MSGRRFERCKATDCNVAPGGADLEVRRKPPIEQATTRFARGGYGDDVAVATEAHGGTISPITSRRQLCAAGDTAIVTDH